MVGRVGAVPVREVDLVGGEELAEDVLVFPKDVEDEGIRVVHQAMRGVAVVLLEAIDLGEFLHILEDRGGLVVTKEFAEKPEDAGIADRVGRGIVVGELVAPFLVKEFADGSFHIRPGFQFSFPHEFDQPTARPMGRITTRQYIFDDGFAILGVGLRSFVLGIHTECRGVHEGIVEGIDQLLGGQNAPAMFVGLAHPEFHPVDEFRERVM